jgi:hypothetical protein
MEINESYGNVRELERARIEALTRQDPERYARLCEALGVTPEDSYMVPDSLPLPQKRDFEKSRKANKLTDRQRGLVELAQKTKHVGINVDNIFADTEAKAGLLREALGYRNLTTGRGNDGSRQSVPLMDASPERIGKVFRERFIAALTAQK